MTPQTTSKNRDFTESGYQKTEPGKYNAGWKIFTKNKEETSDGIEPYERNFHNSFRLRSTGYAGTSKSV
jgi:hypothetical protein